MGMKLLFIHRPKVILLSWIYHFPGILGHDVKIGYKPLLFEETRVAILALEKDTED